MISLLVVNYRSAALAIEAIRSARAATVSPLQVVVVDNSLDPREAERLRGHADVLLAPDKNLGYAGGVNAGRPHCHGDIIIVSNPDVAFGPSSIDELAAALGETNVAAAGPALYWDDAFNWMLPPSELHTATEKLGEALASRNDALWRRRDRRRTLARIAFWSLTRRVDVRAISGAIMAIRAADFDDAGGFDERFPLYFEENDFLRRLARQKKRIVYAPDARCRHLYNQSAGADSGRAARAYAESEMLYLAKWYGGFPARVLKRIERPRHFPDVPVAGDIVPIPVGDFVVEASPLRSFDTAAGHFARTGAVEIPAEVWASYQSPVLYFRVVERRSARIVATYARKRT